MSVLAGLGHLGGPPRVWTPWAMPVGSLRALTVVGAPGHGEIWGPWSGQVARPLETLLLTAVIEKQREDSPR